MYYIPLQSLTFVFMVCFISYMPNVCVMQLQQVVSMMHSYVNEFYGWNRYERGYFEQPPDIDYMPYILYAMIPEASAHLSP